MDTDHEEANVTLTFLPTHELGIGPLKCKLTEQIGDLSSNIVTIK